MVNDLIPNTEKSCTEISLGSISNMFYLGEQDLFSNTYIENLKRSFGPIINASVGRYGIDITDMECRVLEIILKGFTDTGYLGNYKSISKNELSSHVDSGQIDLEITTIENFPRLKITQSELLNRLGISRNQIGAISRVVHTLETLSSKMFTIYYERKSLDDNGREELDSRGRVKYESVVGQGALLTILRVQDRDDQRLKNYEIILNPVFLENRESHCLLIPSNWRHEVSIVVGNKKTSPTVFKFLIFLRYAFELYKRSDDKKDCRIDVTQDELARILKISDSVIKNRKRTKSILEKCYSTAKDLGYISEYSMKTFLHSFQLNEEKYYTKYKQTRTLLN